PNVTSASRITEASDFEPMLYEGHGVFSSTSMADSCQSSTGGFWPNASIRLKQILPLPHNAPKTRPVVCRLQMHMLAGVTRQCEQARPVPELKYPVEMGLLLHFLGEQQFVMADQKCRAHSSIGGFHLNEAFT